MENLIWAKMHGATTHFPVALVLCSVALDGVGYVLAGRPCVRDLHAAGYWSMVLAAIGSVGAVISGIMLTRGEIVGHGMLRMHHLFVWPAFALLVGLATWRVVVGRRATRPMFGAYLAGVVAAAVLVTLAAYWGGELLLRV